MSYQNKPMFDSAARLAALARFVSDNNSEPSTPPYTSSQKVSKDDLFLDVPRRGARELDSLSQYSSRSSASTLSTTSNISEGRYRTLPPTWKRSRERSDLIKSYASRISSTKAHNDDIRTQSHTQLVPSKSDDLERVERSEKNFQHPVLIVESAGFKHGNYAEIKFGPKVFIPRLLSRRGISVLCLTVDHKTFKAWNFDFYPNLRKTVMNRNFINLLKGLPGGIYIALAIKDDAHKNLFGTTKNYLSRNIGCKMIWRLGYRDSWCAIIHKKSFNSFEVIEEKHNPNGIARVSIPIPSIEEERIAKPVSVSDVDLKVRDLPHLPQSIENEASYHSDNEVLQQRTMMDLATPRKNFGRVDILRRGEQKNKKIVKNQNDDVILRSFKEQHESLLYVRREVEGLRDQLKEQIELIKKILKNLPSNMSSNK